MKHNNKSLLIIGFLVFPIIAFLGGIFTYSQFQKHNESQPEPTPEASSKVEQSVAEKVTQWADTQPASTTSHGDSAQQDFTPVTKAKTHHPFWF